MEQQTTPLVCSEHRTQYIGAIIIGIIVGAGASFVYFSQAGGTSYQAGWNAAIDRVKKSDFGRALNIADDTRVLSGTVTKINGNRLTLHLQSPNPFDDPVLDDRAVTFDNNTKVSKLSLKDSVVFQNEIKIFEKSKQAVKDDSQGIKPPMPFVLNPVDIASITIGDTLNIVATENIRFAKEFLASEIHIQ